MKSLTRVKQRAREFRTSVLQRSEDLFEGLVGELAQCGYKVRAVDKAVVLDADAVLSVPEKKIRYDRELENDPIKRLLVVAHEAGHVLLHKHRLDDRLNGIDPLSPYFNTGGPALARYNRRSREEIEADAFANEFACPSDEVFSKWLADVTVTSSELAAEYKVSVEVMLSRLAEALFERALTTKVDAVERQQEKIDDEEQKKAAFHFGSPALVNAGPGTGKTATLIMRTECLLREKQADPKSLLMLTFSNEAAEELRTRIEREFGVAIAEQIEITTFHGLGHATLLEWNSELGKEFIILDEARQEELVFELLGKIECDPIFRLRDPLQTARDCVRQIVKLKEKRILPDDLEGRIAEWEAAEPDKDAEHKKSRAFLAVYRAYEVAKSENEGSVDFPDLINRPLSILESDPKIVEALRAKYKWVMVDEYQDVSSAVAQLLGKICGPDNPPWVVGDLRQAIYVFCGAAPQNITNFPQDFQGAEIFELRTNYRSCSEVIDLANQLAAKLDPDGASRSEDLWICGSSTTRLDGEDLTVKIAQANSDIAEYGGIAAQVEEWLNLVDPENIAVLARRNKDVRKVALELSRRGIKVATPGLISSDGSAGLLACVSSMNVADGTAGLFASVSSYVDGRKSSLPRIVYALSFGRFDPAVLDQVVEHLTSDKGSDGSLWGIDGIESFIAEIKLLEERLDNVNAWGDAFTMICSFLFDGSEYLRRILGSEDESQRLIEISEILSTLSWAVSYRYSHPDTAPRESRIGFAQFFRGILAAGRPALVPPPPIAGAVQVMTCHASKGLEFPCVVVAGQTLSLAKDTSWLPPGIESPEDDRAQANSLLFVGATRAQRSLLISFAKTPRRNLPDLLETWLAENDVTVALWEGGDAVSDTFTSGAIWGFPTPKRRISATGLDKDWCGMKVYLQDIYGGRFPTLNDNLYPLFFAANRRAIGEILARYGQGLSTSQGEATDIFLSHFNDDKFIAHPLYQPYKRTGIGFATGFANEVTRLPRPAEILDTDTVFGGEIGAGLIALRFGITAHFVDQQGNTHAILFRPESMDIAGGVTELPWSKLNANKVPLLLLREVDSRISPWIFSGADQSIYQLKWNRNVKGMDEATAAANERRNAFSGKVFDGKASDFQCETRCDNRVNCPYWMKQNVVPMSAA